MQRLRRGQLRAPLVCARSFVRMCNMRPGRLEAANLILLEQMTLIDPRASRELALKARLDGGQAVSLSETTWDVSGFCQNPRRMTVEGRQYRGELYNPYFNLWTRPVPSFDGTAHMLAESATRGHAVHMEVRCGRCRWCLNARRREWTDRAIAECTRPENARTWFITLTANPATQLRWTGQAYRRLDEGGTKPDQLDAVEWYQERCKEAGRDLQLYVKRLRKLAKSPLRALWVFERHEGGGAHDGLPHIHGLLHESEDGAVNYRLLRAQWLHGFIHAKVLTDDDESVGQYIAKCCGYLSKSTGVRIRASRHYGLPLAKPRPKGIVAGTDDVTDKKKGLTPQNIGLNKYYMHTRADIGSASSAMSGSALPSGSGRRSLDQPQSGVPQSVATSAVRTGEDVGGVS